ncbi:MAG TPA: hypothetical protein VHQ47_06135 [Phycisphaerae bacterium]|nr:hypothetical protein [Phycisphaerae bacterium]HWB99726.1 hypothetical protein [Bryobacteraceae bacterium]
MRIDYTDTQLPEDELRELLERRRRESAAQRQAEIDRKKRWYDFRWVGGM